MNERVKEFSEDIEKYITESNVGNNYCILVYASKWSMKSVKLIYKTVEDFKNKVEKDIQNIDSTYGIDFQFWTFD